MNARASALHRAIDAQWSRRECDRVVIDVPRPPSVNGLTFNVPGRGRVRTDRYRTWLRAAGNELMAQRPGRISGAYLLTIQVGRAASKRRDLDNIAKASSDLLVTHRIVEDDSYAERVTVEWTDVVEGARLIVEKWGAPGLE